MEEIEALHTAARRYAGARAAEWERRYSVLQAREDRVWRAAAARARTAYGYSDEALAIFPRYNVLHAIQAAVEAFTPADFASLDDAREQLARVAISAENLLTRPPQGEIERGVMDEERALFVTYLRSLG